MSDLPGNIRGWPSGPVGGWLRATSTGRANDPTDDVVKTWLIRHSVFFRRFLTPLKNKNVAPYADKISNQHTMRQKFSH